MPPPEDLVLGSCPTSGRVKTGPGKNNISLVGKCDSLHYAGTIPTAMPTIAPSVTAHFVTHHVFLAFQDSSQMDAHPVLFPARLCGSKDSSVLQSLYQLPKYNSCTSNEASCAREFNSECSLRAQVHFAMKTLSNSVLSGLCSYRAWATTVQAGSQQCMFCKISLFQFLKLSLQAKL